jgi:hypothetical protein
MPSVYVIKPNTGNTYEKFREAAIKNLLTELEKKLL